MILECNLAVFISQISGNRYRSCIKFRIKIGISDANAQVDWRDDKQIKMPGRILTCIVSGRYRFTIGYETREVGPGDTLLKQDGVMHGCVCLEGGVMLDFFTPMREDFV